MKRTIAVFRIGQLGDTVVALPAISLIRKAYPSSQIVLITDQHAGRGFVSAWDLLRATECFSDVLFYDAAASTPRRLLNSALLAMKLRRFRTGVLFYLAPFPRTQQQVRRDALFFRNVCGISEIYGLHATNHLVRERDQNGLLAHIPSEVDRLLAIVSNAPSAAGLRDKVTFALPTRECERAEIDRRWSDAKLVPCKGPIIGVGPGSKMPAKRWPRDRFISVVKAILKDIPEARFIVLGGSEDEDLGLHISAEVGTAVTSLAGQLSLLESTEVLRRCSLFLGNDTGLMHLAAAVGTQCVALFSARDNPGKWYPYGKGHIVFRKTVPCEGCLIVECRERDMACLKDITSEEVSTACLAALNNSQTSSCARYANFN
jgi:heptosyltransferase-3